MRHTFDADNQSLGRLATKVAIILRGKDQPSYTPNKAPTATVVVNNVSKLKFNSNKLATKTYYHYSGYPGGLKERSLEVMFKKQPEKVFRAAVYGMLPNNKLRAIMLNNLVINP